MRPVRKFDVRVPAIHNDARRHLTIVRSRSGSRPALLAFILIFVLVLFVVLSLSQTGCSWRLLALAARSVSSTIADNGPELLHLRAWHHFVVCTAEHEHWHSWWKSRCLSRRALRQPHNTLSHSNRIFTLP